MAIPPCVGGFECRSVRPPAHQCREWLTKECILNSIGYSNLDWHFDQMSVSVVASPRNQKIQIIQNISSV